MENLLGYHIERHRKESSEFYIHAQAHSLCRLLDIPYSTHTSKMLRALKRRIDAIRKQHTHLHQCFLNLKDSKLI